ncbi:MAG: Xaa-Pro peptidase family protein [Planctomycetota bacterium]
MRLIRLLQDLKSQPIDAILITNETNVRYLTGFTGDSSWLLVSQDDTVIMSDRRYETQIAKQCPDLLAAIRPPDQKLTELLTEVILEKPFQQIGFEADHVSIATLEIWQQSSPNITWTSTSDVVETLRSIKDDEELATIRRAISIAERAFISATHRMHPRMTERELALEIEVVMRQIGASAVGFDPIVGAHPNGALPHYQPGDVALGDCPTLLIDWGARVDGYCSDLTRTLHRASAPNPSMKRFADAYQAVLESQQAAIDVIRDGIDACEVDAAARQYLDRAGLGEAFKHGLGHGFGLQIHESPRLSPMSTGPLKSGMVITVEPGVYFEGEFGIRIEDDIVVTDTGCEVLSSLPKGLEDCRLLM